MNPVSRAARAYWRINLRIWGTVKGGIERIPGVGRSLETIGRFLGGNFVPLVAFALFLFVLNTAAAGRMDVAWTGVGGIFAIWVAGRVTRPRRHRG